ncbi:DivIVA domain-containing protein [Syntrophomonas wolfei]|jgi:cell division initiation protein|nr:DivIVA domain-containing protein [Syntrophomonas wolfei]
MITAMEIRNQQFPKSLRGFKQDEVKKYLLNLAQDYESLYSENASLKEKIQNLEYELKKYRKLEETMNNSLILAQQTAEDLKSSARKEADLMLEESKKRIIEVMMVYQEIIKRMNIFNVELKSQVSAELELLEKNQKKIEELSNFFYSKDFKEVMESLEKVNLKE